MTQVVRAVHAFYTVYRGDLTDHVAARSLDTTRDAKAGQGVVGAAQTVDLRTGKVVADGVLGAPV